MAVMHKGQYITSSLYTFENMREGNYLYVDKTEYLWKLVQQPHSMFFFSRPRRFGKSLTLSTLKAIFQGKKELFKELFIENQPYDWKSYPVLHIDMGSVSASSPDSLTEDLMNKITSLAFDFNIELSRRTAHGCFEELIQKLHKRDGKVVILVDEYDKPILNNIENENIDKIQALMKIFYSVIKTCEPYERFVFITGVGKFLKVSVFSDLNNLNDISMHDDYSTMCGYTEKELETYFKDRLIPLATKYNFTYKDFCQEIKNWYDGYCFSEEAEKVYNPVSFTKFLENNGKFKNYWFETGTPNILFKLFKKANYSLEEALNRTYNVESFAAFSPTDVNFISLMYQTGYLTIKDSKAINHRFTYKLGFPNYEIEDSFYNSLINSTNSETYHSDSINYDIYNALENDDVDKMMSTVDYFLAGIPYDMQLKNEKYYQTVFYSIFKIIGTGIKTEVQTSNGRIDAIIENDTSIYIFEFKLNKSAKTALDQIITKEYYKPFLNTKKKITLIGADFDSSKRRLNGWKKSNLN